MRRIIGIFLVLVPVLVAQQHAPSKSRTGSRSPASAKATSALSGPWLPTAGDFPPGFTGHNPAAIYDAALRTAKKYAKSEFETQAQHEARLRNAAAEGLTPGLKLGDMLVFTFAASGLDPQYDAEKQEMSVSLGGSDDEGDPVWSSSDRLLRTYTGSNAFGVRRTIREYARLKYVVAFQHPPFIATPRSALDMTLAVSMPANAAQKYMKTMAVALIGHLEFPFAEERHENSDPTIDHPFKVRALYKTLHLRLEEVRFFDRPTGKVLYATTESEYNHAHPLRVELLDSLPGDAYVDSVRRTGQISSVSGRHERTLAGSREIRLEFYDMSDCSKVRLKVNEKPFTPRCEKQPPPRDSRAQIVIRLEDAQADQSR